MNNVPSRFSIGHLGHVPDYPSSKPISRVLRRVFWLALVIALISPASTLRALTPEDQAVLVPLQGLFDGMTKRDHSLVREQLLPGGVATFVRNGQVLQLHFDAFVDRLPTTGLERIEERIHDPLIRIDHEIAVVWAPYVFTIDGKVDHCGTDLINLIHRDGRWLIAGIEDNSRKVCSEK
jgi:putative lumazine-binding protein